MSDEIIAPREHIEVEKRPLGWVHIVIDRLTTPLLEACFDPTKPSGNIRECRTSYPAAQCTCGHYLITWKERSK
jgi:hypothetical protein